MEELGSSQGLGSSAAQKGPYVKSVPGQVWKKVKCDGTLPSCKACTAANVPCVVSMRLRRRTKIRGFHTSAEQKIDKLQAENEELRKLLQREQVANAAVRSQAPKAGSSFPTDMASPRSNVPRGKPTSINAVADQTEPLIRHMGRLVLDCDGIERFAGSTTGVHFILSVQQTLQERGAFSGWFPDNCFRMHVMTPASSAMSAPSFDRDSLLQTQDTIFALSGLQPDFIMRQIRHFVVSWASLCPVIISKEISRRGVELFSRMQQRGVYTSGIDDNNTLLQLILIFLINTTETGDAQLNLLIPDDREERLLRAAASLLPAIMIDGQLSSLQSVVLVSFFYQITGHHTSNINLRGVLLQKAQSLGLHRHSRRFKFSAAEVELRKRLWWYIYALDKSIAIAHGLPRTVNDADVDVDYPLDGDLEDMSGMGMSLPLPGETTPVHDFIRFCHLSRVLSSMLSQLYTTTDRRGGPEKISRLDQQLRTWHDRFDESLNHTEDIGSPPSSIYDHKHLTSVWLPLMQHVARLLIHRPGLTFDPSTPKFRECLAVCTDASSEIVDICTRTAPAALRGVIPPVHALVFQCGMMHIFYHLHSSGNGQHSSEFHEESSAAVVERAIVLLSTASAENRDSGHFVRTINDSVALLQSLSRVVLQHGRHKSRTPQTSESENLGTGEFQDGLGTCVLDLDSGIHELGDINQLESLSWVFDDADSPLIGLTDG
ncbi:hypothetical protein JX266_012857 [Neoarthrinium moseri]|nr:hypothetical protein JX266_012857 [Neoarthrinium moseri]